MRVLLLNQYFYPDLSATAQITTDLALQLRAHGDDVRVITGRRAYVGKDEFAARETFRGIDIHRVALTSVGRQNLFGRALDFATFLSSASIALARSRDVDVVVTLSTPPLLSMLGVGKRFFSRTPFVYWVQDLYPDVAVQLGVLGARSPATRILDLLSRSSLRHADAVVTLGDCMARQVRRHGVNENKLSVIHNWADGDAIRPLEHADNWFRRQHELEGKFVALYSGNMGRAHRFDTLIAAAERLADHPDIIFLFVGAGPRQNEVEVAAERLPNIRLLPYQAREDLTFSLGAADLALITMEDSMEGLIVPSKLYGHLASGRPILFVGPIECTTAEIIRRHGCGAVFSHGSTDDVVDCLTDLAAHRARGVEMGKRSRAAYDSSYNLQESTRNFSALLERIAN